MGLPPHHVTRGPDLAGSRTRQSASRLGCCGHLPLPPAWATPHSVYFLQRVQGKRNPLTKRPPTWAMLGQGVAQEARAQDTTGDRGPGTYFLPRFFFFLFEVF